MTVSALRRPKRPSAPPPEEEAEPIRLEPPFADGFHFYKLFWVFMAGCFLGVVIETIWCLLTTGRIESRVGLVIGPFNPVYGFGAFFLTLFLHRLQGRRDLWIFLASMFIGGLFEFLCSLWQELSLHTVSWEYSHTQLNIDGRTNLMFSFFWGLLGLVWLKDIFPRLSRLIEKIPKKVGPMLTAVALLFIAFDIVLSYAALERQSERRENIPAENAVARYLDAHYPDETLKLIYPNMTPVKDK